jgi:hypothetical protein
MTEDLPEADPRRVTRKTAIAGVILALAVGIVAWSAWQVYWHGESAAQLDHPPATAAAPPSR